MPIDPPGTSGTRIIRITNVRANANQLGVSSTLIPTQVTANISVSPPNLLPLNNPQQTVAFVARGLVNSVQSAVKFVQCNGANVDIAGNPASALNTGGQNGQQFSIRFDEGFPSAWKEKNIQTHISNSPASANTFGAASYPPDAAQDVAGANYFSESGFLANGVSLTPGANPASISGYGPFFNTANAAFPSARGMNIAGLANAGTRLMINFGAVANGAQIFVPTRVNLTVPAGAAGNVSGFAVLVSGTDVNGGGGFSAATGNPAGLAPVTVTGGAGVAVYEILFTDPFNIERMSIPVAVAFASNTGSNLPAPGVQSTVTASFAPLSNVGTASDTAPIPRFAPGQTPLNDFIINKCSCNILFPFVTNQQGFDTGVAIANTSVDPFGTSPQVRSGDVELLQWWHAASGSDNERRGPRWPDSDVHSVRWW